EIQAYGFGASYYDKLATMIASKEIPDVMFINDVSNWEPLAKQGVLEQELAGCGGDHRGAGNVGRIRGSV
ncbi:MAG TPA: hypothetical protein IAB04_02415, partial [Candidatus Avimonoglobus intestinipullorum]|nr:hypothetical protein [Candidatus Avimonoglobus intestinipullorum]